MVKGQRVLTSGSNRLRLTSGHWFPRSLREEYKGRWTLSLLSFIPTLFLIGICYRPGCPFPTKMSKGVERKSVKGKTSKFSWLRGYNRRGTHSRVSSGEVTLWGKLGLEQKSLTGGTRVETTEKKKSEGSFESIGYKGRELTSPKTRNSSSWRTITLRKVN